jgi:hypothetical protein
LTIELLHIADCPGYAELRPRLERLLTARGLGDELVVREIASAEEAAAARFLGSPTLRIDGRDVEPGADRRTTYAYACRTYGAAPAPPDELILDALG